MTTTVAGRPIPAGFKWDEDNLDYAIRDYVRIFALRHERQKTMETFGVSRHTLRRFPDRSHMGRALTKAVMEKVGERRGSGRGDLGRLSSGAHKR